MNTDPDPWDMPPEEEEPDEKEPEAVVRIRAAERELVAALDALGRPAPPHLAGDIREARDGVMRAYGSVQRAMDPARAAKRQRA